MAGVRSVEMRVRDVLEDGLETKRYRRKRYYPEMLSKIRHRMMDGPSDPIQLLILASFFREEAPWLYEIALETYRAIRSGDATEASRAVQRYREALEMLHHMPFLEVFGREDKMMHMMLMDALDFMPSIEIDDPAEATKLAAKRKRAPL